MLIFLRIAGIRISEHEPVLGIGIIRDQIYIYSHWKFKTGKGSF